MKYEIHYAIYNCENIISFRGLSQYFCIIDMAYVMEKEFKGHFKIIDIFDLEHERRKQHDD